MAVAYGVKDWDCGSIIVGSSLGPPFEGPLARWETAAVGGWIAAAGVYCLCALLLLLPACLPSPFHLPPKAPAAKSRTLAPLLRHDCSLSVKVYALRSSALLCDASLHTSESWRSKVDVSERRTVKSRLQGDSGRAIYK